ncbi:MAG: type I-E CRISPR-associated protein Cse2/CasB [Desulfovibrionaceae bacterium]|nr:type I-E CRISPR-associated protein Cse2/CasB [Desulfovibrionaceae bacterium]
MREMDSASFVRRVIDRCRDRQFAMSLCYTYEPYYHPGCLSSLGSLGVDLNNAAECRACAVICASLARSGMRQDGTAGLGEAIFLSMKDMNPKTAEMRLISVVDGFCLHEVCWALTPVLHTVARNAPGCLCHARLLDELRHFERARDNIRRTWVHDFCEARKAAQSQTDGMTARDSLGRDQDFDGGPSPR